MTRKKRISTDRSAKIRFFRVIRVPFSSIYFRNLKYKIAIIPINKIPPKRIAFFFTWKLNWSSSIEDFFYEQLIED